MTREPSWCDRDEHDRPGRHSSRPERVGAPTRAGGHGEVTVWLEQDGGGPTMVAVNVADGVGVTAELSLVEARRHRDHLDDLIRQAARPRNERR